MNSANRIFSYARYRFNRMVRYILCRIAIHHRPEQSYVMSNNLIADPQVLRQRAVLLTLRARSLEREAETMLKKAEELERDFEIERVHKHERERIYVMNHE